MTRIQGNHTFDSTNTRANIARLLAALEKDGEPTPKLYHDLRAELHMTERTFGHYVKHLKAAPRRIRTAGHELIGSRWHRILALGTEPDCPHPKPKPQKVKDAQWRKKVRQDPELRIRQEQREKARWIATKTAALPKQGPFAALGL